MLDTSNPLPPSATLPTPSRSLFPSVNSIPTPTESETAPDRVSRPTVFSPTLVAQPLAAYNVAHHAAHFASNETGYAVVPIRPEDTKDPYLFPTLTKHERERVTSLWYYTRDIHQDKPFLAYLQHTVNLVKELTERDCAVVGLLDLDYYTQLVITNATLDVTPRRETICAHTIMQEPGTVFQPDMSRDWRFTTSPHVKAGLAFYAGTQLRYAVPGAASEVAFGSLCVASWTPQPPLDAGKQRALTRFADILVHDIVERARVVRASDRHKISATLAEVTAKVDADNVVELLYAALQSMYPAARIALQDRADDTIALHNNRDVPYVEFENYLWEDSAGIDEYILRSNQVPFNTRPEAPSLRAIAVKRSSVPHSYLVVQTPDMKHIFDDIDAAFVQSCALIMCNVQQAHRLQQAMAAKTLFLRGVTHQLRTPIHAILSTCELLLDQTRAQTRVLGSTQFVDPAVHSQDTAASLSNAMETLSLIDTSGRSLLSTVNNLLNFDRLGEVRASTQMIDLAALEQEVLDQLASAAAKRGLTLVCDNQLPADAQLLEGDLDLLKQCLTVILQNAVEFTERGTITLTTSLALDYTCLTYDIVDSGIGIADADAERIFNPFEKVDVSSPGPGLGLAVAASIAGALGGAISLVSSSNQGSHFQVRLKHPTIACEREHVLHRLRRSRLPKTYHMPVARQLETVSLTYATRHLERVGFAAAGAAEAALALVETSGEAEGSEAVLRRMRADQIVLYLCRDDTEAADVDARAVRLKMDARTVVCTTPVYRAQMWRAIAGVLDAYDALGPGVGFALVDASPQPTTAISMRGLPAVKRTLASLKVLIVDDNRTNLSILCMNAKRRDCPYMTATDGQEAVNKFKACRPVERGGCSEQPITVIFMDLQMPVMDGVEATAQIRRYESDYNLPPCLIYMVTGQSSDDDKRRSVAAGADGYFVKPLSLRMLNDLIQLHFPK